LPDNLTKEMRNMKVFYNLALAGWGLVAAVPLVIIVAGAFGALGAPLIAGAMWSVSPFSTFATGLVVVVMGLLMAVVPCTAYAMLSMQRAQLEAMQALAQNARASKEQRQQQPEHLPIVIGGISL
jgi:hypothetical protein